MNLRPRPRQAGPIDWPLFGASPGALVYRPLSGAAAEPTLPRAFVEVVCPSFLPSAMVGRRRILTTGLSRKSRYAACEDHARRAPARLLYRWCRWRR